MTGVQDNELTYTVWSLGGSPTSIRPAIVYKLSLRPKWAIEKLRASRRNMFLSDRHTRTTASAAAPSQAVFLEPTLSMEQLMWNHNTILPFTQSGATLALLLHSGYSGRSWQPSGSKSTSPQVLVRKSSSTEAVAGRSLLQNVTPRRQLAVALVALLTPKEMFLSGRPPSPSRTSITLFITKARRSSCSSLFLAT